jgi:hypothetical protein
MADKPPPEVERAAAVVDAWLKNQPGIIAGGATAPRPQTAAERFSKMVRPDRPAVMPAWKDPRG